MLKSIPKSILENVQHQNKPWTKRKIHKFIAKESKESNQNSKFNEGIEPVVKGKAQAIFKISKK
jgi:hypothetical protein